MMTSQDQEAFAKRYAGKLMECVGDSHIPRQDVVVVGYPPASTDFVTIRSTADRWRGWRRGGSFCTNAVWLVDTEPGDPAVYWFVRIDTLTPRAAAPVKYPNFPHKCTACGEPAYVGAYDVDCISPACVHYRATRP